MKKQFYIIFQFLNLGKKCSTKSKGKIKDSKLILQFTNLNSLSHFSISKVDFYLFLTIINLINFGGKLLFFIRFDFKRKYLISYLLFSSTSSCQKEPKSKKLKNRKDGIGNGTKHALWDLQVSIAEKRLHHLIWIQL